MNKGSDWTCAPRDEDAEEDPHTVMHVYEGDGGVIIRDGGDMVTIAQRPCSPLPKRTPPS